MAMTEEVVQQGADTRNVLAGLVNQFFQSPTRMQEARQVVDAEANQAFDAVTGNFRDASRQQAQGLARRGLQGSSIASSRQGALQQALSSAVSGIEAQRQGRLGQARQTLEQLRQSNLQQAFQPNPLQQQTLSALNAALGGQFQAAQQQGQFAEQARQFEAGASADFAQALTNPANLAALITQLGGRF